MRHLLSMGMALVLLLALTACTGGNGNGDSTTTASTTSSTTTTTTQSAQDLYDYNALTGTYDLEKGASNRPIALMVPNDSKVIGSQVGIDKADFYMECETEGAIPRLLTVFASVSRIPDTYGPLRSARTPFVATARALDAVYIHAGGSVKATELLDSGVMDRFNALTDSKTFWRDADLRAAIDLEHSLVTGREKLTAKLENSKFSKTMREDLPFTFGDKTGDGVANKVQLNTTPSHRATFIYDSETGLYGKNIGKMDSCKPHTSMAGDQIKVSNVLVLYAEKYAETSSHWNFREGTGNGYLISGGTYRPIKFTRTADSLTIQETDGTPAVFAQGKIYMVLAANTLTDTIIFK